MITNTKRLRTQRESKKTTKMRYNFTLYDPEARTVYVVGDFNGWNAYSHPLKKDSKGKWKLTPSLTPGRYEYLFLVDDQWKSDPRCTNLTPNIFGGENCVLKIT